MKVGDLIYDSYSGLRAIIVKIHSCTETSTYMSVLYEDGKVSNSIRMNDPEIEVISESR